MGIQHLIAQILRLPEKIFMGINTPTIY